MHINIVTVDHYLKKYSLGTGGTMEARIDRLERLMASHVRDNMTQMAHCDICDHDSDADLPECPFCADGSGLENDDDKTENKIVYISRDEAIQSARPDKYTASDLDNALDGIRKSSRMAATEIHAMGKTLTHIRDNGLWKLRKNDIGGQVFLSFQNCITAELGLQQSHTNRLIRVADTFTADQIEEHGITRLSVSLRLEPSQRETFFTATADMSARGPELADVANNMSGITPGTPRAAKPPVSLVGALGQPVKAKTKRGPPSRVVYEVPLGQRILTMWKRPRGVVKTAGSPETPAKALTDDPWLSCEIAQDLHLSVRLRRSEEGDIQGIVDLKHEVPK